MPGHDLLFSLNLSDGPPFDEMLSGVATSLLGRLGYSAEAVAEISAVLHAALVQGAADGRRQCDVQFRVEAGKLQIVVSYAGGREWRASRPLP